MDSRKPLRPNYRNKGMKKVLEETIAPQRNYATTAGIRIGQTFAMKGSEVSLTVKKTGLDVVRSRVDDIRKETRWERQVHRTSVNALCQLHEHYVDGKR